MQPRPQRTRRSRRRPRRPRVIRSRLLKMRRSCKRRQTQRLKQWRKPGHGATCSPMKRGAAGSRRAWRSAAVTESEVRTQQNPRAPSEPASRRYNSKRYGTSSKPEAGTFRMACSTTRTPPPTRPPQYPGSAASYATPPLMPINWGRGPPSTNNPGTGNETRTSDR